MSTDWWIWLVIGFLLGGGAVVGVFWYSYREYVFWPDDGDLR